MTTSDTQHNHHHHHKKKVMRHTDNKVIFNTYYLFHSHYTHKSNGSMPPCTSSTASCQHGHTDTLTGHNKKKRRKKRQRGGITDNESTASTANTTSTGRSTRHSRTWCQHTGQICLVNRSHGRPQHDNMMTW